MKLLSVLFAIVGSCMLGGCFSFSARPSMSRLEYQGPPLPSAAGYSIESAGPGADIFTVFSPDTETVLLNLYDADGKLEFTIYEGAGGVLGINLDKEANKYYYDLKPGPKKIVLYGGHGMAEFSLTRHSKKY